MANSVGVWPDIVRLVKGRTQTHIPWPAVLNQLDGQEDAADTWFHDLLHPDGSPYDQSEVDLIGRLSGASNG